MKKEIYFQVPASTDEAELTFMSEDDSYEFYIVFFESPYSDTRKVTIRTDCTKDRQEETTSLSSNMDAYHNNEFVFDFKLPDDTKICVSIFMDSEHRSICVSRA